MTATTAATAELTAFFDRFSAGSASLDPDLLAWFKRQGRGYQARINAALRAFVEAHKRAGRK